MSKTLRLFLYRILEQTDRNDRLAYHVNLALFGIILLSVIGLTLETVDSIEAQIGPQLQWIEAFAVIVFTVEYVARLWCCNAHSPTQRGISIRLKKAMRPMMIIDLLAIVPFYLSFFGVDLIAMRLLRTFRWFRVAKLARYSNSIQLFGRVMLRKKEELILTLSFTIVLLIIASSLMYYVEHEAQPDKFSSIPAAMWWGITTLTTVGYGDTYPITLLGRLLAAIIAILGIGLFALPTSILGAAFVEELGSKKTQSEQCPHCGKSLTDHSSAPTD
ncbi:MAG: ion transporter [Gammaproteobacteria bacterium]|nr:ion transporter [Gammaproteobacteria bacterium]MDH5729292.1 ion transporter [Gammaproteobacteria bacterium]